MWKYKVWAVAIFLCLFLGNLNAVFGLYQKSKERREKICTYAGSSQTLKTFCSAATQSHFLAHNLLLDMKKYLLVVPQLEGWLTLWFTVIIIMISFFNSFMTDWVFEKIELHLKSWQIYITISTFTSVPPYRSVFLLRLRLRLEAKVGWCSK